MSLHGGIHLILKFTTNIPDTVKHFAAGAEIYAPDKLEPNLLSPMNIDTIINEAISKGLYWVGVMLSAL